MTFPIIEALPYAGELYNSNLVARYDEVSGSKYGQYDVAVWSGDESKLAEGSLGHLQHMYADFTTELTRYRPALDSAEYNPSREVPFTRDTVSSCSLQKAEQQMMSMLGISPNLGGYSA